MAWFSRLEESGNGYRLDARRMAVRRAGNRFSVEHFTGFNPLQHLAEIVAAVFRQALVCR